LASIDPVIAQSAPPSAPAVSGPAFRVPVNQVLQFDFPKGATFTVDSGADLLSTASADGALMVKALKPGRAVLSITAPGGVPRYLIIQVGANTAPPENNNGAPLTTDGATETLAPAVAAPPDTVTPLPALAAPPKPALPSAMGPIEPSAQISPNLPPPARLPAGTAAYPTTPRRGVGSATAAQRPAIGITQGLARLMQFNTNILAVFFSDDTVMDARAINARTIAITGKTPGKSTLAVFTQTSPTDVIGRANIYRIEVGSATAPVAVIDNRLKDPVIAATTIRTALNDPRIDVSVIQSPDGNLVARLTGTVRDKAEVDAAVSTAKLFVGEVYPSLIVDVTAPTIMQIRNPGVAPLSNEEALQVRLRELTGNQTIKLTMLPSGLVVQGEVNSPEEAQALMRLLPPINSSITPLLVIRGTQARIPMPTMNTSEDRSITERMQDVTGVGTVYAVRTASNAIAIYGTVRNRREYDAVRRFTQVLPLTIGATATPAGATASAGTPTSLGAITAAALSGSATVPTETRFQKATLATAGYTMPTQIQMFVEILDPNEAAIRTVTLETNLVEISRNNARNLGVQVGSATVVSESRSGTIPGTIIRNADGSTTRNPPTPGSITRTLDPTFNNGSLLGGNGFAGLGPSGLIDAVRVRLNAIITNGNARILSQPNVTAMEGMDAQITVGGVRPVPSTSTSGGGAGVSTESIEFRRFGVILTMRPTVTDDDTIILQVRADVTAIDPSTAIVLRGAVIPGETVRSVNTTLIVREGDIIAIGGLISNDQRYETSRVPILSKIPILGELFKSKRFERNETELAIFMQPRITRHRATMSTLAATQSAPSFPDLPGRQDDKGPLETLGENATNN